MLHSRPAFASTVATALMLAAIGPGKARAADPKPFTTEVVKVQHEHEVGMASFYRGHGKTSSGMTGQGTMTAAHRKLPFGSRVKVRDVKTGREVVVVITDRGPFHKSRVIDLSPQAAKQLGITGRGVARVELSAE
jgi:rare lipoprotein A